MKVAVSIPDDIFADADRLAKQFGSSRSAFYADALKEFIRARESRKMIDQWNAVIDSLTEEEKEEDLRFVRAAAAQMAARGDW